MESFPVLTLYPLWAIALTVGVLTLRLGSNPQLGLSIYALGLSAWVSALIAWHHPEARSVAERAIPSGMLIAAAIVHAGLDLHRVKGPPRRRTLLGAYGVAVALSVAGAIWPRALYAHDFNAPGPAFFPVAVIATAATLAVLVWLARAAFKSRASDQVQRTRAWALFVACGLGAGGGGGIIFGHVTFGLPIGWAAPLLTGAILLSAYSLLRGEAGRSSHLLRQGIAYAVMTAVVSSVGLYLFFRLLPHLTPNHALSAGWVIFVIFVAALPLDPLRSVLVETIGRKVFREPMGVRDLANQIEQSENRADHAERLAEIGTLASAVAHEIRNPLGIIAAETKMLERSGASPESVDALKREVQRTRRFIDELLAYSKPRPLRVTSFAIREAINRAAKRATHGASLLPVELDIEPDEIAIEADVDAFEDVLVILISNAVAAINEAGTRIRVRGKLVGALAVIAVEDDGPGVSDAVLQRMFEPFVSGRGRDAAHPGTGLGLAIARRWVIRHGGQINHQPSELGGAAFITSWPLRSPAGR